MKVTPHCLWRVLLLGSMSLHAAHRAGRPTPPSVLLEVKATAEWHVSHSDSQSHQGATGAVPVSWGCPRKGPQDRCNSRNSFRGLRTRRAETPDSCEEGHSRPRPWPGPWPRAHLALSMHFPLYVSVSGSLFCKDTCHLEVPSLMIPSALCHLQRPWFPTRSQSRVQAVGT